MDGGGLGSGGAVNSAPGTTGGSTVHNTINNTFIRQEGKAPKDKPVKSEGGDAEIMDAPPSRDDEQNTGPSMPKGSRP